MNEVKYMCKSCNREIGKGTNKMSPPLKCQFCGSDKVGTQTLEIEDRKSFDYECMIYNKLTGVTAKAGFTIAPSEYVGKTGEDLKVLFASRLSTALSQILKNTKMCYDLVTDEKK